MLKSFTRSILRRFHYDIVRYREMPDPTTGKRLEVFTDIRGRVFPRFGGYRDRIVPNWRQAFDTDPAPVRASEVAHIRSQVQAAEDFLKLHGTTVVGRTVLEVGSDRGGHALALAEQGAESVEGIDTAAYGARQRGDGQVTSERLKTQRLAWDATRSFMARHFQQNDVLRVQFRDLDVAELTDTETFDIVFSWETLEHVSNPKKAFENIARALKPGGITFHEYNPFFSVDGGHSACTLDFPWGHVRLSEPDIKAYLRRFRPVEADRAIGFLTKNLNRMVLSDLREYTAAAGLDIVALIPWADRRMLKQLGDRGFQQCSENYAQIEAVDLISGIVWVLLKKPTSA